MLSNIANLAVILGGISLIGSLIWKVFLRYKETSIAIDKTEKIDSIIESMNILGNKVDAILNELQPNSGKSIKDIIDKTKLNITFINNKLEEIETQMIYSKIVIKNLANNNNSGYWISNNTGETIEVSYTVCKMLKKSEDTLLGLNWMTYLHEEDRERIEKSFINSIKLNKDFNEDYRIYIENNQFIKVNAYAKRIIIKEKFLGYYGIIKKII